MQIARLCQDRVVTAKRAAEFTAVRQNATCSRIGQLDTTVTRVEHFRPQRLLFPFKTKKT